jgi:excisionase family DNA binding protein
MAIVDNKHRDALLTRDEAANYLHVQPGTLRVWACERRYPLSFVKVGRAVRYRLEDLDTFIASRTVHQVEAAV